MIRKRTAFKPNLNQVATQPSASSRPQVPNSSVGHNTHSKPTTDEAGKDSSEVNKGEAVDVTGNATVSGNQANQSIDGADKSVADSDARPDGQIDEISSRRVHEAITQLTCQKFEPIKSISLRNSANKNVKIKDLLFYNPPLTKDQKRHKKNLHLAKKNEKKKIIEKQRTEDSVDVDKEGDHEDDSIADSGGGTTEEHSLIPKVKMGPEGKLVLDESSTFINRKNSIKTQEAIVEDNEDVISRTNYDSFRRKPSITSQSKWSIEDTQKFYHALTILGTDFSMMETLLFSGLRSRTELHKKFKREERANKAKIDIALSNRITVNSEELDGLKDVFHK